MWRPLLCSYICPGYLVIWLFGRNFMLRPLLTSISPQVIGLFSYLVEMVCGDLSLVARSVKVIGLFGYLVEILC